MDGRLMKQTFRKTLTTLLVLTLVLLALPSVTGHTASADTIISSITITGSLTWRRRHRYMFL